jgi:hypothetical protein
LRLCHSHTASQTEEKGCEAHPGTFGFGSGDTDFEDYLREFGLVTDNAVARQFHYRKTREPERPLDRRGVPCVRHRDLRCSDDYEAMNAAMWTLSLEAVADEAGVSFSRVAKALRQTSPFNVRRFW